MDPAGHLYDMTMEESHYVLQMFAKSAPVPFPLAFDGSLVYGVVVRSSDC